MKTSPFICPVCGSSLFIENSSLVCENRHCFDLARSGYVNLLTSSGSGRHGDDKLMVRSRTEFLNKGYYEPLADKLVEIIAGLDLEHPCIIDAGCGEGYYTEMVEHTIDCNLIGIDISKYALMTAAKRVPSAAFAAASTASIPLRSAQADIVLNIFSPLFPAEFSRVLKDNAYLVRVVPMEKHLLELKQLIYENAYENPAVEPEIANFEAARIETVKYKLHLADNYSVKALFMMTPYYYKTGKSDQEKLNQIGSLDTTIEFCIILYKKKAQN